MACKAPKHAQNRDFCMEKKLFLFEIPFGHEYNFDYKYLTVVKHSSTFRFFKKGLTTVHNFTETDLCSKTP